MAQFSLIVSVLSVVLLYLALTTSFTVLLSSPGAQRSGVMLATSMDSIVNCTTATIPTVPPKPLEAAKPADQPNAKQTQELVTDYLTTMADSPDAPAPIKAAAAYMQYRKTSESCDLAAAKKVVSWDKDDGRRRDVGVCLQIRNDAALLDEFIAFHWLQGVGHFQIYDDNSQDDPWSVLQKYAGLGIVEYFDMQGHPMTGRNELQTDDMNACITDLRARYDELGLRWLIIADVDEFFLSSNRDQLLTDLLNDKYRDVACMEIGRTYYGTSFYHRRPPNGSLVTETYLLASPDYADGFPKMMANIYPDGNYSMNATKLYSVHNFWFQADIPCRWQQQIHDIRINHYVRSLEDYDSKIQKNHKEMNRYATNPLHVFWERDRNDHLSPIASDYACRVHALIDLVQEMGATGNIPRVVMRPTPWNETQTTPMRKDPGSVDALPTNIQGQYEESMEGGA